jgi:cytosine/adenosine deaminase-related metal-dependent hydrolase
MLRSLTLLLAFAAASASAQPTIHDRVILNGRVMDPESGLDAVRHVGILGGKVARISAEPLVGRDTIDAAGLVVAPGFIDLHVHWHTDEGYRFAALDGVTTALELEGGVAPVAGWYAARDGRTLINFGASASHGAARRQALAPRGGLSAARTLQDSLELQNPGAYRTASGDEIQTLVRHVASGLQEGALGVGMGLAYVPGAGRDEIFRVFEEAARAGVPVFVHIRHAALSVNQGTLDATQEVIANAAASGAALHIVHVTSTGLRQTDVALEMIRGARARGVDVTTEMYPYEAASTDIRAAIFDPGWQERLGITERDIMWFATGERLTPETFAAFRRRGGPIVAFVIPPAAMDAAFADSTVIIASDGVPLGDNSGHPRGAGTYARVLGKYVRDEGKLPLMQALRRMTLLPAQRLERWVPQMRGKGRLAVGADADVTIFDAARVIDRATYQQPKQAPLGIPHVLVAGVPVVRNGAVVPDVKPGSAIRRAPQP